jgi:hypothetical protein
MCNLYSITRGQEAMRRLFRVTRDLTGNLPALPAVYPGAPVVRIARADNDALGLTATAKPRHSARHQRAQCEVALLARMAQERNGAASCRQRPFANGAIAGPR